MRILLPLIISASIVISCGYGRNGSSDHKPLAAVSIFPLYEAASNIAGDRIQIFHVLPAGADPHTFEPQPSAAMKLRKAELCVIISEHFDGWMKDYLSDSARVVHLSSGGTDHHEYHGHHDGHNPHIWLYPPDMEVHIEAIKDALIDISPGNRDYFEKRFREYSRELKTLDRSVRELLSGFGNPAVVQWHPAWDRFMEGYGIEIVSTIEKGHADTPGLKRMKESISTARESGTRVVILDPRSSAEASASYLKAVNGIPTRLDPLGGTGTLMTYRDLIMENARILAEALSEAERSESR